MTVDGKAIVSRYDAYRDLSEYGLMFPTHWTETVGGKPYLDLKIDDGRVASYAVFPKPDSLVAARYPPVEIPMTLRKLSITAAVTALGVAAPAFAHHAVNSQF